MKTLFYFLLTFITISCNYQGVKIIQLNTELDLFPEGISMSDDAIFISSILKNKIIKYDLKTKKVTDFIASNKYNFGLGLGLFIRDSLLFAISNENSTKSSLSVFNIKNGELVKKYDLHKNATFWNDLVIDSEMTIYISDTKQNKIYNINFPKDDIVDFFADSTISSPNGLAISDDNSNLFIASDEFGIRILDLKSKRILNEISLNTKGIDGLKFSEGNLYGIINADLLHKTHGLYKMIMSNNFEKIIETRPILVNHKRFNVPTTFDICNNYIYILANSQMDNLNQEKMSIIDKSKLTKTYIIKLRIKNGILH